MQSHANLDRVVRQLKRVRDGFAHGEFGSWSADIDAALADLLAIRRDDAEIVPESLAVNAGLMRKIARVHHHLFVDGGERLATDVVVLDERAREAILLRRGADKRLFADSLTVPATLKGHVTDEAAVVAALDSILVWPSGASACGGAKVQLVDRPFRGRLVARQVVALDDDEAVRLRRAVESVAVETRGHEQAVHVSYNRHKQTATVWSVSDVAESAIVDVATRIGDATSLPVLYPVSERRSTRLRIVTLSPSAGTPTAADYTGDSVVRLSYDSVALLRREDVAADTLGMYLHHLGETLPRQWSGRTILSLADPCVAEARIGGKGRGTRRVQRAAALATNRPVEFSVPATLVVPARIDAHTGTVPAELHRELVDAYRFFGSEPIILRSSATQEDGTESSFSGMAESVVVRSEAEVVPALRRVLESVQSAGFRLAAERTGARHVAIAVLIQPFVPSVVGGVAFTSDFGRPVVRVVAASSRAGGVEAVVSGECADLERYVVNPLARHKYDILESNASRAMHRALCDADLLRLVSTVTFMKDRTFGDCAAVDVEWLLDSDGQIHIVQARPLLGDGSATSDDHRVTAIQAPDDTRRIDLGGLTAQPGVAVGELWFGDTPPLPEEVRGKILVTYSSNNEWNSVFSTIAAIATVRGAEVSHASNNAREMGIPAVVGVRAAAVDLVRSLHGSLVTIDATRGTMYVGDLSAHQIAVTVDTWLPDVAAVDHQASELKVEDERTFGELRRTWPNVFEESRFDDALRRKSAPYCFLQRHLYYLGWQRLTAWLQIRYGGRGVTAPSLHERLVWADHVLYRRFDPSCRRGGVFGFLASLELSFDETVDLIRARQAVLDEATRQFDSLCLTTPVAFEPAFDSIITYLSMAHLGHATSSLFDSQFLFPQMSTIQPAAAQRLQNAAVGHLTNHRGYANLTRDRDALVRVIAAMITERGGSIDLLDTDQPVRRLFEELNADYKLRTEDLRLVDEAEGNRDIVKRFLGDGVDPPIEEAIYLMRAHTHLANAETHAETLLRDCVRRCGGDPDNAADVEGQRARIRGLKEEAAIRELNDQLVLDPYECLSRVLAYDKQLRNAREDCHHVLVRLQRRLSTALTAEADRRGIDAATVFGCGVGEVIEMFDHGRPMEQVSPREWRVALDEAEQILKDSGDTIPALERALWHFDRALGIVCTERSRAWTLRLSKELCDMEEHIQRRRSAVVERLSSAARWSGPRTRSAAPVHAAGA